MIIDCHAHIIEHLTGIGARGEVRAIGKGKVRFLDGTEQMVIPPGYGDKEFTAETFIHMMDEANVDKAVLLHGLLYGLQNDYVYECVKRYPERLIASGSLDPYIERIEEIMERFINYYGFKILKFELSTGAGMTGLHPDMKIDGAELEKIYAKAEQENITIVLDIGSRGMKSYQIDEIIRAARKYVGLTFVICHLLAVNGKELDLWKWDLMKLEKCPNIYFDITAVPWNVKENYPFPASLEIICEARDIVGTKRMMWGSDVPQLLVMGDYKKQYDYLLRNNKLSKQELDNLLFKTAKKVYLKDL